MLDFLITKAPNEYASYFYIEVYGGRINSYPVDDSSYIHRDSAMNFCLDVFWYDSDDPKPVKQFLQDWWTGYAAPVWNGQVYQNYPSEAVADYRASYWGKALDALVAVKAKYDPMGFFKFNQMVSSYPKAPTPLPVSWPPKVAAALVRPIARTYASPWGSAAPIIPPL
jgi:hypothetical protein